MGHTYALGAVKPHVRSAAQEIGDKFNVATIYGVGTRANVSDHPIGLALDFMVNGDRAKGDQIASYVKANWQRLGIKYEIWWQRIDNGSGWEPMEDRGGTTANHKDHVHVSFTATGAGSAYGGNATDSSGGASDSGGGVDTASALAPLTAPATWIRVLEFVAGAVILLALAYTLIQKGVIGNATS